MGDLYNKLRVLIVDDDIDDQIFIREAIKHQYPNSELISFYNGKQVLDYMLKKGVCEDFSHEDPHIVILDINMPFFSGFDVLKELKQYSFTNTIFVMLSTSDLKQDIDKAFKLGADGFFTKPDTVAKYRIVIKEIISKRTKLSTIHVEGLVLNLEKELKKPGTNLIRKTYLSEKIMLLTEYLCNK
ncbi:MAG: response regulator [Bacteroidetes bacterium]|nr:response regulator [Bacteroidota bacterium]